MSNNVVRKITRSPISVKDLAKEVSKAYGGELPLKYAPDKKLSSTLKAYLNSIELISIDVKSLINRDTCDTVIKKLIKNGNGFDFSMWNPPLVGRLPNGDMLLYDGDHSRALYRMFFPKAKRMPVRVKEFESKAEIHNEFVKVNSTCITPLTKEEIFVHEVHGKNPEAMDLCKKIEEIGCSVYCSHESGGIVGKIDGPSVGVVALKKVISFSEHDLNFAAQAVDTIMSAAATHKREIGFKFPNELLGGLTQIYVSVPGLADSNVFRKWFSSRVGVASLKSFASEAKNEGGNIHNHADYSAARGLLKMFRQAVEAEIISGYVGKVPTTAVLKKFSPEYKKKHKAKLKAAKKKKSSKRK